ncbi:GH92 family glycosyl hydrolase [Zhouia sp. PK063]|uniref:GH92 family glycosyl hydrolase n=1 Tax=Zhouia sp. PK063 TaxID=3373602 RepID=UPI0037AB72D1
MKKNLLTIAAAASVVISLNSCKEKSETPKVATKTDVTAFVDPLIGTGGHGHTFPGVTTPFGMIQLSPDNGTQGWDWCSGYNVHDSIAVGFSHLHLSGTGIGDLCDLLFMPTNKKVDLTTKINSRDDYPFKSRYSHDKEIAKPGLYSVFLEDPKIQVNLTTTDRVGFHKYTYQKGDEQDVVIDLGFAINWDKPTHTSIKVENETTVSGYRFSTGWAKNQKVFFVAKFSKPIKSYDLYANAELANNVKEVKGDKTATQLFFDTQNSEDLEVKVAVSSVSVANAKENLASAGEGFNFDAVKNKTQQLWQDNLAQIEVETPIDSLKTIFYTALFHTHEAPATFSDVNGEFRLQNDSIFKGDFTAYSSLSLWDTFRAEQPLIDLLRPDVASGIINSLLAYYDENKTLPVWNLYGNETYTMTGNHAVPIIAEAYLKGVKGFDAEKAYQAVRATMMSDHDNRGVALFNEYGYVPFELNGESVTKTLELAYDDWCAAQMAKGLGKEDDYKMFLDKSMNYKNLYDPTTGFMRGKSKDGKSFHEPFDPLLSIHRVNADYTEGNAWQHSWFVPQDPAGLIALHGGDKPFVQMLDSLFTQSSAIHGTHISPDISGLIGQYAHGNEPSHHIAYMFNKANAPWKTQYWVHHILKTQYTTKPDGLSGNEDCGQMSAWYVFSAMGIYPMNPSSTMYEIGSPALEKSSIHLPNGNTFTIKANHLSDANFYIQSATLNGEPLNTTEISHETVLKGGELVLEMGDQPNKEWGVPKK